MELIAATDLLRFSAALIFVIALMGGLAVLMKRINAGRYGALTGKRRLRVREMLALDGRRRAVLIQRDDREHLVILGPNGETVIETGIESPPEREKLESKTSKIKNATDKNETAHATDQD